jgi:hypothetical protein
MFPQNIDSFPYPSNAKVLTFHITSLSGDGTAQPVVELSVRLLLSYKVISMDFSYPPPEHLSFFRLTAIHVKHFCAVQSRV